MFKFDLKDKSFQLYGNLGNTWLVEVAPQIFILIYFNIMTGKPSEVE